MDRVILSKVNWECECEWNAIQEKGLEFGHCKVLKSQETSTDWGPGMEMHIECRCPKCDKTFEYFDGYP